MRISEQLKKTIDLTYKKLKHTLNVKSIRKRREEQDRKLENFKLENQIFTSKEAKNKELVMAILKKKGRKPRDFYKIILN
jgi:hypothetical protein